jgi:hypothetical protein
MSGGIYRDPSPDHIAHASRADRCPGQFRRRINRQSPIWIDRRSPGWINRCRSVQSDGWKAAGAVDTEVARAGIPLTEITELSNVQTS